MNFIPNFQAYPMTLNVEIKQESIVPQNIFNCSICNETFRNKKNLKDHKQRQHQQINNQMKSESKGRKAKIEANSLSFNVNYVPHQPKFQCEYCFKGFDQSHRLKQHQISHREPIFQCDQCEKKFKCQYRLKYHKNEHTPGSTQVCNVCHKIFPTLIRLQQHQIMHNDKIYHCQECDKGFKCKYRLKYHELNHYHKAYECPICTKRFALPSRLAQHLSIHDDNTPSFSCDFVNLKQTMKIFIFFLISTVVTQIQSVSIVKKNEELFPVSIIHLNDFHARFEETNWDSTQCKEHLGQVCIGGYARVMTIVKQLLKERNEQNKNPIYLNIGDNFQGTLWYELLGWNVTSHFLNILPADATTLGNHEFDRGVQEVVHFLEHLTSPVVVSNLDDTDEPSLKGLYKKSIVIERSGRKIGLVGALVVATLDISSPEKLHILNEIESVKTEASRLKTEENVDIIIVLSHCGLVIDREMAINGGSDIDVIVGGHSHTLLYSSTPVPVDVVANREVGEIKTTLYQKDCAFGECNVGSFVTDAFVNYFIDHPDYQENDGSWTYATIAITNAGGIRTTLSSGVVSYDDLFTSLPFQNTIDTFELQGKHLLEALEFSAAAYRYYNFLQFSGLRVVFNVTKSENERVVSVDVLCRQCDIPKYEKLDPEEWYRIIMPSFIGGGGNGYVVFGNNRRNHRRGDKKDVEVVELYLKKMTPVIQRKDGRNIVVI
ncbi:CLUMA_CG020256, isoform A [Clunio marinus]|uniref:CLUMA_CG020256, isoform A n=1 Tax=Clunio marinus TaxID=568069 RepID=A0A1J1J4E2_9DIPT|nr:CLUMA_CG020256, isoform A [Clunio marinus]